jgi:hypothetical protein
LFEVTGVDGTEVTLAHQGAISTMALTASQRT